MAMSMNEVFRIAHLSDLHLSSLIDVKIRDLLNKRALGYLSWRLRRRREHVPEVLAALCHDLSEATPDHIVITGDLIQIGLPSEFQQARQWLETLGRPADVTVVPGNHDAYVRTSWEDTFALWAPYMASDQGVQIGERQATGRTPFPSVRVRGPAALIGVSSAHQSAPFFATGSLGATQMNGLGDVLDLTRRQGLFRILLIHHPPMAETVGWRKRLTDGAALMALLARYGVEMILHGHTHRSSVAYLPELQGTIPMMGVASASARGRKPEQRARYHVYEVRPLPDGWEIRTSERGYSMRNRCFVADDQRVMRVPGSRAGSLDTTVYPHRHPAQHGQRA
jgi:3',5'-cyclic AMP phosphodiesterase CpdA